MKKWGYVGIGFLFVLMGSMGAICYPTGHAIYGVQVNHMDVSGMSPEQIHSLVEKQIRPSSMYITVQGLKTDKTQVPLQDIGIHVDANRTVQEVMAYGYERSLPAYIWHRLQALITPKNISVMYGLNEPDAQHYLTSLGNKISSPGEDAYVSVDDGHVVYHPRKVGRQLDVKATLAQLKSQVSRGVITTLSPVIRDTKANPAREKALQAMNAVLGTYETYYNVGAVNRSHNIALAANKVNRVLLQPGEVFSFNDVVGERTAAAGYDDAPVYLDGKLVPGIGGGICQVSSTLFNSALLAGLSIIERTPHFEPVSYTGVGRDATVSYGSLDLKFKNIYEHPVYIITENSHGMLRVTIVGQQGDEPQSVQVQTHDEKKLPHQTVIKVDKTAVGDVKTEGRDGISVQVTRHVVRRNGSVESDTFTSVYDPVSTVVVKGKPKEQDKEHQKEQTSPVSPSSDTSSTGER